MFMGRLELYIMIYNVIQTLSDIQTTGYKQVNNFLGEKNEN